MHFGRKSRFQSFLSIRVSMDLITARYSQGLVMITHAMSLQVQSHSFSVNDLHLEWCKKILTHRNFVDTRFCPDFSLRIKFAMMSCCCEIKSAATYDHSQCFSVNTLAKAFLSKSSGLWYRWKLSKGGRTVISMALYMQRYGIWCLRTVFVFQFTLSVLSVFGVHWCVLVGLDEQRVVRS